MYYPKKRLYKYKSLIAIFLFLFLIAGLFFQQELSGSSSSSSNSSTQQITVINSPISQVIATAYFIDVGQGDSSLFVFSDGKTLLIDSGIYANRDNLFSALSAAGVSTIDCLVGTHQDSDHIGSFDKIIENYPIGKLYLPAVPASLIPTAGAYKYLADELASSGLSFSSPSKGDVILSGDNYQVTVLSDNTKSYPDLNDYSIVLMVTVGDTRFLMMGDAEGVVDEQLLKSGTDLHCDVLHVQHHGSNSDGCTSDAFLQATAPSVAIISCGIDNSYGDPSQAVLSRLRGVETLRTDQSGTIEIQTNGKRISAFALSPTS